MTDPAPSALLLIATGCAHCAAVLESLANLLKEGQLGRLDVVNIVEHPEVAQEVGTRSVPWTRIGLFEITGSATRAELDAWTRRAAEGTGVTSYYSHLLETNRLDKVISSVREQPGTLEDLVLLLQDPETPMGVRIGIGAVFEDLQDTGLLATVVDTLGHISESDDDRVRVDACHYLGLTRHAGALPYLRARLDDDNPEVREVATESRAIIKAETSDD
ncbi:MAG: HEAT repeat domain-containing protein [Pseudomonadota bacterium]